MATEKDIFEQYCSCAITKLLETGIIRDHYDWDVFKRGQGAEYTIRVYNKNHDKQIACFVLLRKKQTIRVVEGFSEQKREFDMFPVNVPAYGCAKEFAEFVYSFAKELI